MRLRMSRAFISTACWPILVLRNHDAFAGGCIEDATLCWASTADARRCGIDWSILATQSAREELQHVYYRFVALADRKKNIYDQDLIGILPDPIRDRKHEPVTELD